MLKLSLRRHSVSSPSVLGELEAKGVNTSKITNIVSPLEVAELHGDRFLIVVTWDNALSESDQKDREERRRTLALQFQPEMVHSKWIFLTSSISMGDWPSVGETTIPMPYCIVSEEGKDPNTEVDWPSTCARAASQKSLGGSIQRVQSSLIWTAGGRSLSKQCGKCFRRRW